MALSAAGRARRAIFLYFPDGVPGTSQNGDASEWHPDGSERYQGTVFPMSQGIEAGVNRLAWGPEDGALYVGGVGSNGNWNHQGHTFGLERLVTAWEPAAGPDAARAAGAQAIVLGSSELGLLLRPDDFAEPIFDSTEVHALAAARWLIEGKLPAARGARPI